MSEGHGTPYRDEPASKQLVLDALDYYLEWSIEYMEAARMGDEAKMKRLDEEWNPESLLEQPHD